MRRVLVLALVALSLAGCSDTTINCPQSLGPEMVVAGIAPMPVSPPKPPAPPAPRAPAPRAPQAPSAPKPAPAPPKVQAPKPPPRYVAPPRAYRPPAFTPPQPRYNHQTVYVNNHHDPMPYLWMTMMYTSTLHNQQAPEGCNP